MEICRSYARDHGRAIVFDTARSGLYCRFEESFVPKPDFGAHVFPLSKAVGAELNEIADVYPALARSIVSSFKIDVKVAAGESGLDCYFSGTEVKSHFEPKATHSARLLVHSRFGGGQSSIVFLSHVALTSDLANRIARRLLELPKSFDAIHIRATDMVADLSPLEFLTGPVMKGRQVMIASDSDEIKDRVSAAFAQVAKVMSAVKLPKNDSRPLHKEIERGENFIEDTLTDLFALARSERLFFTLTDRGSISGYAMLAESLRVNPGIFKGLFEHADRSLVRRLFPDMPGPRGLFARWGIERRRMLAEQVFWKPQPKLSKALEIRRGRLDFALGQDIAPTQRLLAESAPRD
jgi:hypothetical protein